MSDHFGGIRGFVEAITGRGAYDDAAYNASLNRLTRQRSAQTGLDRQLELLIRDKDINRNRGDLATGIDDDLIRALTLGGPGVGANFLAGQRGRGAGTQSDALAQALSAVMGSEEAGGEPPTDFVNALIGVGAGKLSTEKHVQVQGRSDANLRLTEQQILEAVAGTSAEEALAGKRRSETTGVPNLEPLTANQLDMLVFNPETISVDTSRFYQKANVEDLPFDDPRAQKAFSDMSEDERNALIQYLGPEFTQWRMARLATDPQMIDSDYALGKYLEERQGAITGAPVAGAGQGPQSITDFIWDPSGKLVPSQ